jgi:hypothetical protein
MSHHPKSESQQGVVHNGLQSDLQLPDAQTLVASNESGLVLARLRAGMRPRFDTLENYFEAMERKVAHAGLC